MANILVILYGLIMLGILVIVHELGHFLVAKLFGVKVETFSVGMGPAMLKYKKGDTSYQLGYFPLGGYCKMAGDEPDDKLTGAPDEFYSKSPLRRLGIVFAGPFVNYIFGVIIFIIVMGVGMKQTTFSNQIIVMNEIKINNKMIKSPAKESGLKSGDRIIMIEDEKISNWTLILKRITRSGDDKFRKITIKRKGKELNLKVKPVIDPDTGASLIGISPYITTKIAKLQEDGPAQKAGLKVDDTITHIDNKKVNHFTDVKNIVSVKTNQKVNVTVNRKGKSVSRRFKTKNINGKGYIGVVFHSETREYKSKSENLAASIGDGFKRANKVINDIIYSFKLIFSGKVKVRKAVGSPVAIVYFAGKTAEAGFISFLWFMGYISIALAFFNLLPIPAVDGSYIILFLFEIIFRKELNYKIIRVIQYVGLIVLMGLLFFLMFNDIFKFFTGGFSSITGFMS